MLLKAAALCALVLIFAGCGGKKQQTTTSALPPGCSTDQVLAIVSQFFAHPSVAPPGWFRVYGTKESDGRTFTTHRRAAAVAHVEARLRLGERDRVIHMKVAPQDINHVEISFTLTRNAPDFRARGIHSRVAVGAGTIDCAHGKVAALALSGP